MSSINNRESQVSVKINNQKKIKANDLFSHLGLSMSSAIKMFINQCLITKGIPFKVQDSNYDPETQKRVNHDLVELSKKGDKMIERHHLIE